MKRFPADSKALDPSPPRPADDPAMKRFPADSKALDPSPPRPADDPAVTESRPSPSSEKQHSVPRLALDAEQWAALNAAAVALWPAASQKDAAARRAYTALLRIVLGQVRFDVGLGCLTAVQSCAFQLQKLAEKFLEEGNLAMEAVQRAGRRPEEVWERVGPVLPAPLRLAAARGWLAGRAADGARLPPLPEVVHQLLMVLRKSERLLAVKKQLLAAEPGHAQEESQAHDDESQYRLQVSTLPLFAHPDDAKNVATAAYRLPVLDASLLHAERQREVQARRRVAIDALQRQMTQLELTAAAAYQRDDTATQRRAERQLLALQMRARALQLLPTQAAVRAEARWVHHEARAAGPSNRMPTKRIRIELGRHERERRRRRELEERDRRREALLFYRALDEHVSRFRTFFREEVERATTRLNREVRKHFEERERTDQRREREEERRRIQALREDNEEAYRELLRNTKNERLKLILEQTDAYLLQLGSTVQRDRGEEPLAVAADAEPASLAPDDYYKLVHQVRESLKRQPRLLTGGELKQYQLAGVEWMLSLYNNRLNGVLADEMGLGKTVQTIALLCHLVETARDYGPFMIVVPLSTLSNWENELSRWAPALQVFVFKGDKTVRKRLARELSRDERLGGNGGCSFHILLTTYEYVLRSRPTLSRIAWSYIVVDEGHRIKNAESKLAQVLGQRYRSRNRLLLTGTPLHNSLAELWSLLNFLLPNIFSSCETFETWFNAPFANLTGVGESVELTEEESLLIIHRLHKVLRPFLLRRLKDDILRGGERLPEKRELTLLCDMSAWQRLVYRQLVRNERVAFTDRGGRHRNDRLSNGKMQMRKIVNHPYLFHIDYAAGGDGGDSADIDELVRASGKFQMLDACVRKLLRTGHRLLIFNQMTRVMDLQEWLLEARGIPCLRLQGLTTADERRRLVEEFNSPHTPYHVFLLTTRAGGLGVNLQSADTVILFDSDWNPQMDIQAQDRAHRIGQTRAVRVFRLVTARSIEQHVLETAEFKRGLEQKIIRAGMFHHDAKDSEREAMLKQLLKESEDDLPEEVRGNVATLDELNRLLARSDQEYRLFTEMDREEVARERGVSPEAVSLEELQRMHPRLLRDAEVPAFLRAPERYGYRSGRDWMEPHGWEAAAGNGVGRGRRRGRGGRTQEADVEGGRGRPRKRSRATDPYQAQWCEEQEGVSEVATTGGMTATTTSRSSNTSRSWSNSASSRESDDEQEGDESMRGTSGRTSFTDSEDTGGDMQAVRRATRAEIPGTSEEAREDGDMSVEHERRSPHIRLKLHPF